MELQKIENLIEKYNNGLTNIEEEKILKNYFSSIKVDQNLEQYQHIFTYFTKQKYLKFNKNIELQAKKVNYGIWFSIAASFTILIGILIYFFNSFQTKSVIEFTTVNENTDAQKAYIETQKALSLLSENLNIGINSVSYINEFENSKNLIFKK